MLQSHWSRATLLQSRTPADTRAQAVSASTVARSAPAPVSARTSISAYRRAASGRRPPSTVPTAPSRNDSGIDTRPGLSSGNQWKSTPCSIDALRPVAGFTGLPDTAGENTISTTLTTRPP